MSVRISAVILAMVMSLGWIATVDAGNGCGCDAPPACSCPTTVVCQAPRHHCRHQCCFAPPSGPVVASMAAPSFVMPMAAPLAIMAPQYAYAQPVSMLQAAPQYAAPQALPQQTCAASGQAISAQSGRLNDLEARVDALHNRVNTLQTSIEEQTDLLREISNRLKR